MNSRKRQNNEHRNRVKPGLRSHMTTRQTGGPPLTKTPASCHSLRHERGHSKNSKVVGWYQHKFGGLPRLKQRSSQAITADAIISRTITTLFASILGTYNARVLLFCPCFPTGLDIVLARLVARASGTRSLRCRRACPVPPT